MDNEDLRNIYGELLYAGRCWVHPSILPNVLTFLQVKGLEVKEQETTLDTNYVLLERGRLP